MLPDRYRRRVWGHFRRTVVAVVRAISKAHRALRLLKV